MTKTISARRFAAALADLAELPIVRFPALPLVHRVYERRANITAYDVVHGALTELLDCPLLAADRRLVGAPGTRCTLSVLN
ncbi:MAG: hypothetical protein M3Y06_08095 [Actinomycetota bacterium]|nr:hypothetical protein [Actinomycetota bacterium]